MPNLRKRSSVLTYNDDAVYKAIENEKRAYCYDKTSKSSYTVKDNHSRHPQEDSKKIPEFVYADDGRKFYPCAFCCKAFAYKQHQLAHMQQCNFRVEQIAESRLIKAPERYKMEHISTRDKSFVSCTKRKDPLAKIKSTSVKLTENPKPTMQNAKSKQLENNVKKIVKKLPSNTKFPKIKLEPSVVNQNIKFLKHSKKVTPKEIHTCTECDDIFKNFASLVQHKREKHKVGKMYVTMDKLKEYDEMFKNSDMSKCTLCFKPVTKIRWSRHLQTHGSEKNYLCSVCNKSFGRKDHRDVHEKKHIGNLINPFLSL